MSKCKVQVNIHFTVYPFHWQRILNMTEIFFLCKNRNSLFRFQLMSWMGENVFKDATEEGKRFKQSL